RLGHVPVGGGERQRRRCHGPFRGVRTRQADGHVGRRGGGEHDGERGGADGLRGDQPRRGGDGDAGVDRGHVLGKLGRVIACVGRGRADEFTGGHRAREVHGKRGV